MKFFMFGFKLFKKIKIYDIWISYRIIFDFSIV